MDKFLIDKRLTEKSPSESNLNDPSRTPLDTTPPNYILLKRKTMMDDREDDFTQFKEEMKTMMKELISEQEKELRKFFSPTLSDIQKTSQNIENTITMLISKNEELTKKVTNLEQQAKKDGEYITLLESKIEDIQRTSKKNIVELKNVPKSKTETKDDIVNMVTQLGRSIDCNINIGDIKDIFRARGKKDGQSNGPIIVELASTILRTSILKKSKSFNIRNKSKLRAKHLGFKKEEETPIFVSEHLTAKASRLYYLARDLAKSKDYKFCWTSFGRVLVRKDENAPIITITNESQVSYLMQNS